MKHLTTGSTFSTILNTARSVIKDQRQLYTLAGLATRAVTMGFQRALLEYGNLEEIGASLESLAMNPELMAAMTSGESIGPELILSIYSDVRTSIQPYLPTIGLLYLGLIILSVIISIIVIYTTNDAIDETPRTLSQKVTDLLKQIVPYFFTTVLQGVLTLIAFALFFIPGIIVSIYWIFTQYVVLHKKIYFRSAIKESRRMVKGRRRKTLGYLLMFTILFGIILGVVSALVSTLLTSIGVDIFVTSAISSLISILMSLFIQVVLIAMYHRWGQTTIAPTEAVIE